MLRFLPLAVALACGEASGRLLLRHGSTPRREASAPTKHRTRWWGDANETISDEMDLAYSRAREDVKPSLVSNVTDDQWFRDPYADDANNDLLKLTMQVPETAPTQAQVAAAEAKEQAAQKALRPMIIAEDREAEDYYHKVFPFDTGNDLEAFTLRRNTANRTSSGNEGALENGTHGIGE
mmetsp:Transcript_126625/g.352797  ORF Transcript_126625/g.352797 Transcript_126625/m.352797 type:complete len:180 (-) Transcript_126625:88-627(-)